jgi:putative membrane protein (TIGR04086 family)
MRKAETQAQGSGAVQMVTAVMLGGLLALGVELTVLLLGAAAVSNGILKEDSAAQVTAAACVVGGLAGGLLACSRWSSRRLIAGLAVGIVCCLLILAVGLLMGDGFQPGPQALIELAGCLCGGAAAGLLSGRKTGKKRVSARKK